MPVEGVGWLAYSGEAMNAVVTPIGSRPLGLTRAFALVLAAVAAFTLAYCVSGVGFLNVIYLFCLVGLARVGTSRQAFYLGLAVGMLAYPLQLSCFYTIFGPGAVALWLVLAFWLGLFVLLARLCLVSFKPLWAAVAIPFIWTGLEYFRSELYYLRFSWLNVGYAFSGGPLLPAFRWLGMYGLGFLAMGIAVSVWMYRPRSRPRNRGTEKAHHEDENEDEEEASPRMLESRWSPAATPGLFLALVAALEVSLRSSGASQRPAPALAKSVRVAGVQLEFPTDAEVIESLDKLVAAEPEAELLVLSEYTFDGPVPERIKVWCREHQRYLIVGGKNPAPGGNFYDTAFVVGPTGEIPFRQGKAVPIQFFKDGLPAGEQRLWDSPWGRIGLCICYDLSYSRVTDRLIRLGAQALIVPTMDVAEWGQREHELHARVAPVRAAEYSVPIFRVASSGVSQLVDGFGRELAKAAFPGQAQIIAGRLMMGKPGSLPLDRRLGPCATGVTGLVIVWLLVRRSFR